MIGRGQESLSGVLLVREVAIVLDKLDAELLELIKDGVVDGRERGHADTSESAVAVGENVVSTNGEREADGLGHGSVLAVDTLVDHRRDELHRATAVIVVEDTVPPEGYEQKERGRKRRKSRMRRRRSKQKDN